MAGGAKDAAMSDTVSVKIGAGDRHIIVRAKRLIRRLPPLAGVVESCRETLARVVAHLAGRLDDPRGARGHSRISQVPVAAGTKSRIHRASFAFCDLTRVTEITGVGVADRAVFIQRQAI